MSAWRVPSAARLVAAKLAEDLPQARAVRRALASAPGEEGLRAAGKILGLDVEWIGFECTRDDSWFPKGIWMLNVGETYQATVYVRDNGADLTPGRGTVQIGSWGDVVEAHERKCAACRRILAEGMR